MMQDVIKLQKTAASWGSMRAILFAAILVLVAGQLTESFHQHLAEGALVQCQVCGGALDNIVAPANSDFLTVTVSAEQLSVSVSVPNTVRYMHVFPRGPPALS